MAIDTDELARLEFEDYRCDVMLKRIEVAEKLISSTLGSRVNQVEILRWLQTTMNHITEGVK